MRVFAKGVSPQESRDGEILRGEKSRKMPPSLYLPTLQIIDLFRGSIEAIWYLRKDQGFWQRSQSSGVISQEMEYIE